MEFVGRICGRFVEFVGRICEEVEFENIGGIFVKIFGICGKDL